VIELLHDPPHDTIKIPLKFNEPFSEEPLDWKLLSVGSNHSVESMLEQRRDPERLIVGAEPPLGPMVKTAVPLFAQESLIVNHLSNVRQYISRIGTFLKF
jgi:hypothetical protein